MAEAVERLVGLTGDQHRGDAAGRAHLRALEGLAGYVRGLGWGDQLAYALSLCHRDDGREASGVPAYLPGPRERRLLETVGAGPKRAPSDLRDLFAEMVGAAVEDALEAARGERAVLVERAGAAEGRVAKLEPLVAHAEKVYARFKEARREVERLRGELERACEQRDHYAAVVRGAGGEVEPAAEEEKPSKPRRVRVEGEPYLYEHENAGGQAVFEVYSKGTGFRTIGVDRAAAIKARDELHGAGVSS